MEEANRIGQRVLIFDYEQPKMDSIKFGTIVGVKLSEPYNYEELPWYERMNADENQGPYYIKLYKILGDDGKEYNSPERSITGNPYFKTIDSRREELYRNLERNSRERQEYLNELEKLSSEVTRIVGPNLTLK